MAFNERQANSLRYKKTKLGLNLRGGGRIPKRSTDMLKSSIMKIDRRGFLAASSSALVLAKSQLSSAAYLHPSETSAPFEIEGRIEGKEVAVYTTAENTNYRLSATDTVAFK